MSLGPDSEAGGELSVPRPTCWDGLLVGAGMSEEVERGPTVGAP